MRRGGFGRKGWALESTARVCREARRVACVGGWVAAPRSSGVKCSGVQVVFGVSVFWWLRCFGFGYHWMSFFAILAQVWPIWLKDKQAPSVPLVRGDW